MSKPFRSAFPVPLGVLCAAALATAQTVNISGTVADSAGAPLEGAVVKLERGGQTATSGADGKFSLGGAVGILAPDPHGFRAQLHSGRISFEIPARERIAVTAYAADGSALARIDREFEAGSHAIQPPGEGSGARFYRIEAGGSSTMVQGPADGGGTGESQASLTARSALSKAAAGEMYDVVTVTKSGYHKGYLSVSKAETTGVVIKLLKTTSPKFSFFVTSMRGLQKLANNETGFGGDLRFGETGSGAGLRGADKICATLAESSMPGSYHKGWRAFLSVTADAHGQQVNAIDRIGAGPWYDRLGRMLAPTLDDLKAVRPQNGDPTIQNDLPNETGTLNHHPGPNGEEEDNHHTMTGSTATGTLKGSTSTCKDWTVADGASANGKPSCGFAWPRGGGGGFPGGGSQGSNWITTWDAPGCAAGIDIAIAGGPKPGDVSVGGGGGYGGFYCFALNP